VKRVLIVAGLIVALAFPATILAGIRHYEGTVQEGGSLRFATKVRHGETKKVKRFVFNHVPMTCDDGDSTVGDAGTPPPGMKVNSRHKFHGKFASAGGTRHLRIKGKLKRDDRKAVGILRVWGDFGGTSTNCDTGKTHWSARLGD
jgi:hypothetical protein